MLGAAASRASAASHHACGREELPRCWADSETRPQGPAQRPPSERRRGWARWLDSVARDYSADNLMPQADSAGCTLTRLGPAALPLRGPGCISGPPGRTGLQLPHSGPGPRARSEPPLAQKVRPSRGPGIYARGPWVASTTPRPTGSYIRPTAHSLNPLDQPPTGSKRPPGSAGLISSQIIMMTHRESIFTRGTLFITKLLVRCPAWQSHKEYWDAFFISPAQAQSFRNPATPLSPFHFVAPFTHPAIAALPALL